MTTRSLHECAGPNSHSTRSSFLFTLRVILDRSANRKAHDRYSLRILWERGHSPRARRMALRPLWASPHYFRRRTAKRRTKPAADMVSSLKGRNRIRTRCQSPDRRRRGGRCRRRDCHRKSAGDRTRFNTAGLNIGGPDTGGPRPSGYARTESPRPSRRQSR